MGLKYKFLKLILITALVCFPLMGTECNKSESSIIGTWELVKMKGFAQDVCLGEIVEFQTTGNATLTCPGQTPVQKTYTYSGNILTYTTNSLSYSVSFTTQNGIQKLILTGRNGVDRELTYNQISK